MHDTLLSLALIFLAGVGAQWIAWRLRLPSILLLLGAGFVVGPLLGWLNPDELLGDLVFPIVSLFVAIVLFEGGLSLRVSELRGGGPAVRRLVVVGVLVTWIGCTIGASTLLGMELSIAAIFGAILTVTGPTVTVPLLRFVRPTGRVASVVKWEGIVNDPIGAMCAVLVFEVFYGESPHSASHEFVIGAVKTIVIGGSVGVISGWFVTELLRRHLIPDLLHNPVALTLALVGFAISNHFQHESGLLSVTLFGIYLANQRRVSVRHIVEFKESVGVLLIALLFIILAARVELSELRVDRMGGLLAFLALFVFVVRPLAVIASTWGSELNWAERGLVAWMAPKGVVAAAVASVFALRLRELGVTGGEQMGDQMVSMMFLVIIGTVSIYGLTAAPLARWLKLAHPNPQGILFIGAHRWAREIAKALKEDGIETLLVDTNWDHVSAARMDGLRTYYGNAIAETTHEELELTGIGRLFALTPNDEVNTLAAVHYAEEFTRSQVFQLAPTDSGRARQDPIPARARILFSDQATFEELSRRFAAGAVVKRTPITPEFNADAFSAQYSDSALPLFLVTEAKKLVVLTPNQMPKPKSGQTLISLAVPDSASAE